MTTRLTNARQRVSAFCAVLGIVFVIGCHVLLMIVELISTILSEVCAFLSVSAHFLAFCVVLVFVLVTVCRFLCVLLGDLCDFLDAPWKEREAARIRQSMSSSRPQRVTEEVSDKQYGRDDADSYNECVACLDQVKALEIRRIDMDVHHQCVKQHSCF
jgi:hypothetical protein